MSRFLIRSVVLSFLVVLAMIAQSAGDICTTENSSLDFRLIFTPPLSEAALQGEFISKPPSHHDSNHTRKAHLAELVEEVEYKHETRKKLHKTTAALLVFTATPTQEQRHFVTLILPARDEVFRPVPDHILFRNLRI